MTARQDTLSWRLLASARQSMYVHSQYARKKVSSRRRCWKWHI